MENIIRTNLIILEKDMENKKNSRQSKQISEDFALNKVHQMMNTLLVSLHDELKIRNLSFSFSEEQAQIAGFYYYFLSF